MPDSVLITGGAGFVGSTIALSLRAEFPALRVTALDNLHRAGSELNLSRLADAGVRFVKGDVREPEDLKRAGDHEWIIECSAEPSAQAGYGGSPDYLVRTNLFGAYHCLEAARVAGSKFLFLSTSRVYPYRMLNDLAFRETAARFELEGSQHIPGASARGVSERFPMDGARSLYGMTKLAAEQMTLEYADAYSLTAIVNRFGLIAGPWQMGKADQGVLTLWMAAHYFGRPLKYIGFGGTGKQVRDFLHVADAADLVIRQIKDPARYAGQIWNAGGGRAHSLSLLECTSLCRQISGRTIEIAPESQDRPADVRVYLTDSSKLIDASGWTPSRGALETLTDIHGWIQANEQALRPVLAPS